jgi:hypothetical protein
MLAFSQKVLIVLNKHKTCRICTDEQCRAHHQLFASHDFVTDAAECGGSVIPDAAQIARMPLGRSLGRWTSNCRHFARKDIGVTVQ